MFAQILYEFVNENIVKELGYVIASGLYISYDNKTKSLNWKKTN